jgi:hypothetical protein
LIVLSSSGSTVVGRFSPSSSSWLPLARTAGDAVVKQVAEGADRQEALQAEHHGRGIEGGAVVKEHVAAQGYAHGEPIAAHFGQGCGQSRLQLAAGAQPVERITNGAQQLGGSEGGGAHRIHRAHPGTGGHHQALAAPLGLATLQQQAGGEKACGQPGDQAQGPRQGEIRQAIARHSRVLGALGLHVLQGNFKHLRPLAVEGPAAHPAAVVALIDADHLVGLLVDVQPHTVALVGQLQG